MIRSWDPQLQRLLASLKDSFEVHELDLPESPVFIAISIPANPSITGSRPRLPAGRGLTAAQAMTSAAAESVELLAILAQNCDRSSNQFRTNGAQIEILAHNISGGSDSFFPAQRVYLDWALVNNETLIYDADSNGCASGSTLAEAQKRALLECIERDAMAIWWYGRQRRIHLPATCLDKLAPRLSWWLGKRKRQFQLIDVTSDIGVAVVAAVSFDEGGHHIAIGSAAAPDTEQAAVLAVTEMIQMEVSMTMGPVSDELQNWFDKASVHEMPQFQPCKNTAGTKSYYINPKLKLIENGHEIFLINLTRCEDLISTVRVIVPTLSGLRRSVNVSRVISHSLKHPQFEGVQTADKIETLEPY